MTASSIVGFFALCFNLGSILVLSLMLPYGTHVNFWTKVLLAFLFTTGEMLSVAAAIYVVEENRPRKSRRTETSQNN